MIAAAIACVAGFANAGAVNWASGAIQTPGAEGVLSGTKLTSGSGYTLSMYAFESLSAISYSAGDLFSWYQTDTTAKFKGLDAVAGSVNMGASATTATAYGSELTTTADVPVYGAILFVLSDADSGDDLWYMENSATVLSKNGSTKATLSNLSLKVGGTGAATAWTEVSAPVPEPTSGLLLVLGMAGLALRRRRA